MANTLRFFLLALLAGLLLGAALNRAAFGSLHGRELLAALAVTAGHGGLLFLLAGRTLSSKFSHFLSRALCIHGIRVVLVCSAIFVAHRTGWGTLLAFVSATMAGYFSILAAEILSLYFGTRYTENKQQ